MIRSIKMPPTCSLRWPQIKLLALAPLARPAPELAVKVNDMEVGDLGLTDKEESDLVGFSKHLTDESTTWFRIQGFPWANHPFIGTPFPQLP